MKNIFFGVFLFVSSIVNAKVKVPVCFPCENMQTVQELPADSEIHKLTGEKVNIAYLNNEYGAVWVPVWNSDGRFVLSNTANTVYYDIDAELAKMLKDKHNFDIKQEYSLSFWKKIGGKLVLVLLIGLIIWGQIPSKKEKQE